MATRAAALRTTLDALLGDLHVAVATERVKIRFNTERKLGANLVAEVAGISSRRIEKIMVASRTPDRTMIVVIEVDR